jgi:hypothetical protein
MMRYIFILLIFSSTVALAHDAHKPGLNGWFRTLSAGKGPCCDGSDAMHLTDVDWETKDGRYRVKVPNTGDGFQRAMHGEKNIEMEWVDVPEDAVLTQPNLDGETLVWPMYGYMGKTIRCFMPGTLS